MSNLSDFIDNTTQVVEGRDNFVNGLLNINGAQMGVVMQILSAGFNAASNDDAILNKKVSNLESLQWAISQYTGDGEEARFISIGFTPDVVIITCNGELHNGSYSNYGGFAFKGTESDSQRVKIVENGFTVAKSRTNYSDSYKYQYFAVKFPTITTTEVIK